MQVLGQHDHGVDGEWPSVAHCGNAFAERADGFDKFARAAIFQRDSEEICAARHTVPAVVNDVGGSASQGLSSSLRLVPDFASL